MPKVKKQPIQPAAPQRDHAEPLAERARRSLFRPRVLGALALLVSSTVAVPMAARLLPDLRYRDPYRLQPAAIEINDPPECVPDDLVPQVIERADLPDEMSVLDDRLTARLAEAFRSHPWVEEVVRVRKSVPARVAVRLKYRRPAAMVEVQQGVYPVDAAGILLPPDDFSAADARRLPRIQNVQSIPPGPAGTGWGDPAVIGAARLSELLAPHWDALQLAAIRVRRPADAAGTLRDMQYELLTRNGSRILWGRAPEIDYPGELTADQKIGRLRKYLADFGRFDRPHGPYEIDIRHWQEISRRRIRRTPAMMSDDRSTEQPRRRNARN